MTEQPRPRVFIGSSAEGEQVALTLQVALDAQADCEVTVWSQGVFGAGTYPLPTLIQTAQQADFAILVMTADDVVTSRNIEGPAPRDNVILEFGLFLGALGDTRRALVLCPKSPQVKLPSDLAGLTRLHPYDSNHSSLRAALGPAALSVKTVIDEHGRRPRPAPAGASAPTPTSARRSSFALELENAISQIDKNATAQGWRTSHSTTTLRFFTPKGKKLSCPLPQDPLAARERLREFAGELRAHGLRVNSRVRA